MQALTLDSNSNVQHVTVHTVVFVQNEQDFKLLLRLNTAYRLNHVNTGTAY